MSKKLTSTCTSRCTSDIGMSTSHASSSSSKKRSREEDEKEEDADTLHVDKKPKSEKLQEHNTVTMIEASSLKGKEEPASAASLRIPMWFIKNDLIELTTYWIEKTTCGWLFARPVDPKALCLCCPSPCHCRLKDYFNIVTSPMDLGTIKEKLEKHQYSKINEYTADVKLTFTNAILFNKDLNEIPLIASKYWNNFKGVMRKFYKEHVDAYGQYCFSIYKRNNCNRSAAISEIQYQQQIYELKQFLDSFFTEGDLREFETSPEAVAYDIFIES